MGLPYQGPKTCVAVRQDTSVIDIGTLLEARLPVTACFMPLSKMPCMGAARPRGLCSGLS